MPRLRETDVKGVALVKHPANRRPFLLRKSADEGFSMSENVLKAPSDEVIAAIEAVGLSKSGISGAARDTLEAIGRLAHATEGLTVDDVLAVVKAAGVQDVEKGKKEMPQFIKDKVDAKDEDQDGDDDESEDEDEDEKEAPPPKKSTKKSAAPATATKGEAMPASVEKAQQVDLAKAMEAMKVELEKAKSELNEERDHRLTKSIKEEMVSSFPNLTIDRDHLTRIVKAMRSSTDLTDHDDLMAMFKAVDAQVAASNASGGDITRALSKSSAYGQVASGAKEKLEALIKAQIEKSATKINRGEALAQLIDDPKFMALDSEFAQERN